MKPITLKRDGNIKINNEITYYLNPDFVYIPSADIYFNSMHFIYKNSQITKSYKSPISGYAVGTKNNYLVIKNDFR